MARRNPELRMQGGGMLFRSSMNDRNVSQDNVYDFELKDPAKSNSRKTHKKNGGQTRKSSKSQSNAFQKAREQMQIRGLGSKATSIEDRVAARLAQMEEQRSNLIEAHDETQDETQDDTQDTTDYEIEHTQTHQQTSNSPTHHGRDLATSTLSVSSMDSSLDISESDFKPRITRPQRDRMRSNIQARIAQQLGPTSVTQKDMDTNTTIEGSNQLNSIIPDTPTNSPQKNLQDNKHNSFHASRDQFDFDTSMSPSVDASGMLRAELGIASTPPRHASKPTLNRYNEHPTVTPPNTSMSHLSMHTTKAYAPATFRATSTESFSAMRDLLTTPVQTSRSTTLLTLSRSAATSVVDTKNVASTTAEVTTTNVRSMAPMTTNSQTNDRKTVSPSRRVSPRVQQTSEPILEETSSQEESSYSADFDTSSNSEQQSKSPQQSQSDMLYSMADSANKTHAYTSISTTSHVATSTSNLVQTTEPMASDKLTTTTDTLSGSMAQRNTSIGTMMQTSQVGTMSTIPTSHSNLIVSTQENSGNDSNLIVSTQKNSANDSNLIVSTQKSLVKTSNDVTLASTTTSATVTSIPEKAQTTSNIATKAVTNIHDVPTPSNVSATNVSSTYTIGLDQLVETHTTSSSGTGTLSSTSIVSTIDKNRMNTSATSSSIPPTVQDVHTTRIGSVTKSSQVSATMSAVASGISTSADGTTLQTSMIHASKTTTSSMVHASNTTTSSMTHASKTTTSSMVTTSSHAQTRVTSVPSTTISTKIVSGTQTRINETQQAANTAASALFASLQAAQLVPPGQLLIDAEDTVIEHWKNAPQEKTSWKRGTSERAYSQHIINDRNASTPSMSIHKPSMSYHGNNNIDGTRPPPSATTHVHNPPTINQSKLRQTITHDQRAIQNRTSSTTETLSKSTYTMDHAAILEELGLLQSQLDHALANQAATERENARLSEQLWTSIQSRSDDLRFTVLTQLIKDASSRQVTSDTTATNSTNTLEMVPVEVATELVDELKVQDTLLQGYQRENERLMRQAKQERKKAILAAQELAAHTRRTAMLHSMQSTKHDSILGNDPMQVMRQKFRTDMPDNRRHDTYGYHTESTDQNDAIKDQTGPTNTITTNNNNTTSTTTTANIIASKPVSSSNYSTSHHPHGETETSQMAHTFTESKAQIAQRLRQELDMAKQVEKIRGQLEVALDTNAQLKHALDTSDRRIVELEAQVNGLRDAQIETESSAVQRLQTELDSLKTANKRVVASLQQKLNWYRENQTILDANFTEIQSLRQRLKEYEHLQEGTDFQQTSNKEDQHTSQLHASNKEDQHTSQLHASNKDQHPTDPKSTVHATAKQETSGTHAGEVSAKYLKRISALQLRVKQLETALKDTEAAMAKKHPDSVASLVRAAQSGPDSQIGREAARLRTYVDDLTTKLKEQQEAEDRHLRSLRQEHEKLVSSLEKRMSHIQESYETAITKLRKYEANPRARIEAKRKKQVGQSKEESNSLKPEISHVTNVGKASDWKQRALEAEAEIDRIRQFYRSKIRGQSSIQKRNDMSNQTSITSKKSNKSLSKNQTMSVRVSNSNSTKNSTIQSNTKKQNKSTTRIRPPLYKKSTQSKSQNKKILEHQSTTSQYDSDAENSCADRNETDQEHVSMQEKSTSSSMASTIPTSTTTTTSTTNDDNNNTIKSSQATTNLHDTFKKKTPDRISTLEMQLVQCHSQIREFESMNTTYQKNITELQNQVKTLREQNQHYMELANVPKTPGRIQFESMYTQILQLQNRIDDRDRRLAHAESAIRQQTAHEVEQLHLHYENQLSMRDNALKQIKAEVNQMQQFYLNKFSYPMDPSFGYSNTAEQSIPNAFTTNNVSGSSMTSNVSTTNTIPGSSTNSVTTNKFVPTPTKVTPSVVPHMTSAMTELSSCDPDEDQINQILSSISPMFMMDR